MWLRSLLGAVGMVLIVVGGFVLIRDVDVLTVVPWVVVPVIVHDLIVAPLIIAVVWLGSRILPPYARTPAMVGLVVSGSMTLVALSVLGRQGADPNNPSLLDRDYLAGWFGALVLTWLVVGMTCIFRSRRVRAVQ